MSNEIEQETFSFGAMGFMRNPVKPNDLNSIWSHALNYMMKENSKEIKKKNPDVGDSVPQVTKTKIRWTASLENLFFRAIQLLGIHHATPKRILEFMRVKNLTKAHVASKLQKYRLFLQKVNEQGIRQTRMAAHSYNYNTSLRNNNLSSSRRGYGLGQSSLLVNSSVGSRGSVPYMNRRPTYGLSQNESKLMPRGFSNGSLTLTEEERRSVSRTSQETQAPRFGQYGASGDVLGMNSNLNTNTVGSNYAGITVTGNGDLLGLGGIRVNGNDNGCLGGIRVNGSGNGSFNGPLGEILANGNDNGCLGGVRVHGASNINGNGNGTLGGTEIHSTDNENGSGFFGGVRVYGNGSLGGVRVGGTNNGYDNDSLDGIRVNGSGNGNINGPLGEIILQGIGNVNGCLGENLGAKKWNFNNNMSNHGSSSSSFPSAMSSFLNDGDQSHRNFIAQTDDVVLVQENPSNINDHQGTNGIFSDTIDSQFQHQNEVSGENLGLPTYHDLVTVKAELVVNPLEDIDNWSIRNDGCIEDILNSNTNSEMCFPPQDMRNMSITNQGDYNEEILNHIVANPEIYFPPWDMNTTIQGYYDEEQLINDSLEINFPHQEMNTTNQGHYDEEQLITDSLEINFPHPEMNIANQDSCAEDVKDC